MSDLPSAAPTASAHEAAQAAALAKARRRATGLLVVVAVGFVASNWLPDTTWAGYVQAALEAGLVGGLADWFAVVALFRHPLGIPIPHTAVIPKSKAGIGLNLANFVRDNFLAPQQVEERVADPAHLDRLGAWLADPANAVRVSERVAGLADAALDGVDRDAIVDRVAVGVRRRLDEVPVPQLAGQALMDAVRDRRHVALVEATIEGLRAAVIRNRAPLRRQLGRESPAWVPDFVDDLVFDRADEVVRKFLADLADDPDHELRRLLDEQLLVLGRRLQEDPDVGQRVHGVVREAIDDEQVRGWVGTWFDELRRALQSAAEPDRDGGALERIAVEAITSFGTRLQHDEALRTRLLDAMRAASPRLAEAGQDEIGGIIAGTIDRWDADETARRLETWMGPDLQFVRINGTVVGALVGVVLHALKHALG